MMTQHAAAGSAGWPHALVSNALASTAKSAPCLALAIHFITGIAFAMIYGYRMEPQLQASLGQQKAINVALYGIRFAMIPCILSLVVFFPMVGAGPFGLYLGAGPLPILGNIILHAVYGASLALLYGPLTDRVLFLRSDHDPEAVRASVSGSYRGGSLGLIAGSLIGLAIGGVAYAMTSPNALISLSLPNSLLPLTVLLVGSALGCLVGVVLGMPDLHQERPR